MSAEQPEPAIPADPGRRYLTLLFSDLSDSTRLAAEIEAEDYASLLGQVRHAYQATIGKHGGLVVRVQGDGLLAMFGFPQAREDDGRRAVEAALDLHEVVRLLRPRFESARPPSLTLHTGIHSGLVLVEAGDIERGRFELLGPVPNLASRLSDEAEADEILVSEETLGPARHFFATGPLRALQLKGRATPLSAYSVSGRAGVASQFEARARHGFADFVGRRAERLALERQLAEVREGHARLVVLSAPAGMGKTRLAEEFLRHAAAQGFQLQRGYCESYLSAEPLQPFVQMLRALFGLPAAGTPAEAAEAMDAALGAIDPALRTRGGELLRALSLGGSGARHAAPAMLVQSLRELFAALAARRPQVLFVDDWQWADDASAQALRALAALRDLPLMILLASRSDTLGADPPVASLTLELQPLQDAEAAETITRLVPQADPFVVGEIQRYSGGNPLYIEELCHSAARNEAPRRLEPRFEPRPGGGAAAWLSHLVESRVGRLPPEQAELVRAAAVIGNVIPSWLLQAITGCGEGDPLVRGLAEQDFVFPGERPGTLRFKHGITRDVIYDAVGLHPRKALHLRVAEALLQRGSASAREEAYEALAYHFASGGNAAQATYYAELAGDKAVAVSALDRARTQYRAALAALDELPVTPERSQRWMSIAQRLGLVCVFDASRSDLAVFERAVALATEAGDTGAIARAKYWLGFICYSLGDARGAITHCERALAAAQIAGDSPLAVQVVATLGQAHAAACSYRRAMELLDDAIAVKRRHRSGRNNSVGLAYSLVCRAVIQGDRGEFDAAETSFAEALECVVGVTHEIVTSIHGWRSAVLLWRGHWQAARDAALESERRADQTRSLFQLLIARAMAGYADWMMHGQPQSLQQIADATAWLLPREGGLFHSLNHGWLADGLCRAGRPQEARTHAARALQRARQRDLIGVAMAYRALARMSARGGNETAVRRYLARAEQVAAERDSAHEHAATQLCEAELALARGDRARALERLDQAAAAFERMGMDWHLTQARALAAQAAAGAR